MLKNIGFISALALYGVVGCVTAEPGNIPLDGLNTISFNVGEIADGEIADLRHSTCTLRLVNNKKEDSYNYIEGAICPVSGEEYILCHHEAEWEYNNIETDIIR